MTRGKIIFLLLWIYSEGCAGEKEIFKREILQDRTHLQKSQPYPNEEPGFFSKIASWIFPFGGTSSDSIPSPTHQNRPHYLPPPEFSQNIKYLPVAHHKTHHYPYEAPSSEASDCNPCNREPWIPIGGKNEKNTIIQFIPSQKSVDFILDGLNPPPPSSKYYGAPSISVQLEHYKRPPLPHSPSLSNQYESFETYKPNSQHSTHVLPQYQPFSSQYVPSKSILYPIHYEQGKGKLRPSIQYGPPFPNALNPPTSPSILPNPPKFHYGPPAPLFRSKPSASALVDFGQSSSKYEIKDHMVPPAIRTSSLNNYQDIVGMKAPPVTNNFPTTQFNSLKQYTQIPHNIQDILQPPVSQYPILEEDFPPNTRNPLSSRGSPNIYGIEQVPLSSGDNDDLSYPIAFPNLSVKPLAPIHNYINFNQEWKIHQNPLSSRGSPNIYGIEQVPLSSGDNDDLSYPIAFPNLSVKPLAPIHNYINFNQGIRGSEKVESIQILPSVQLADYISSIEYPINVIQSPLVELNSNSESEITKFINISNQYTTYPSVYPSQLPNIIQSGLFVNPSSNRGKLYEEPIVVDDAHASASSHNETYKDIGVHTSKRDEENDLAVDTHHSQNLPLNARENTNDDSTIIENGISHSSDIIITNKQNNTPSEKTDIEISREKNITNQSEFTQPPMDYSKWTPTLNGMSMKISPPPLQSTWLAPPSSTELPRKKTKHVQIIIPYYNFNKTKPSFNNAWNIQKNKKKTNVIPFKSFYDTDSYTTLLPVFKPPSSSDKSVWSDFINDLSISPPERLPASAFQLQSTTKVYNIQDILGFQSEGKITQKLPFDILSLQKNINEWTQQAFAKTTEKLSSNQGVIQKLSPSKKIPQEYFTTVPYDYTTIKPLSQLPSDYEAAGSVKNENFKDDIGNNLVLEYHTTTSEQTTVPFSTQFDTAGNYTEQSAETLKNKKSLWDILQTTFSPVTKEKVYIVTPAPLKTTTLVPVTWSLPPQVNNGTVLVDKNLLYEHPKFSIRIEDNTTNSKGDGNSTTKVIYSEWPHKINNLQTSTIKSKLRHPLFGLMDVSVDVTPNFDNMEKFKSKVSQDKAAEMQRK